MSKVVNAWAIPEWTGPTHGDALEARNNAEHVLNAFEQQVRDIDSDPRVPPEGRPTLRREAATKAREALRAIDERLGTERAKIVDAERGHLFGDPKADTWRMSEIRGYLSKMDVGERHKVVAQAVEAGDVEVLEAVRRAPALVGLVDDRLRRMAADKLDPSTSSNLAARRQAVEAAHTALHIAERRLEKDSPAAEFKAAEQRAARENATAARVTSLEDASKEIADAAFA